VVLQSPTIAPIYAVPLPLPASRVSQPEGACDRTRASGAQGRAAEGEDRGTRVGGDLRDGSGATVGIAPSPSRVHDGDEKFRCVGLIHFTSVASQCSSIETMKLLRVFLVVNSQF
jgi:hypothetical protein